MATISIDDPDKAGKMKTDGEGRLYLGEGFEYRELEVAIRIIGDRDDVK